jgi:riboflavin synthase
MFTGIITEIGSVRAATRAGTSMALELACGYSPLELGESIAVNGACLTVAKIVPGGFIADVSAETLACTTLGELGRGARVNLERALALGDRLGGHIVSGHVDGMGKVLARVPKTDAEHWTLEAPPEVLRFLAVKGSVTVDGVSLTINAVGPSTFEVMLVPFTLAHTTLGQKSVGTAVNLEVDLLARYVARLLEGGTASSGGVSMELLGRAGFLKS